MKSLYRVLAAVLTLIAIPSCSLGDSNSEADVLRSELKSDIKASDEVLFPLMPSIRDAASLDIASKKDIWTNGSGTVSGSGETTEFSWDYSLSYENTGEITSVWLTRNAILKVDLTLSNGHKILSGSRQHSKSYWDLKPGKVSYSKGSGPYGNTRIELKFYGGDVSSAVFDWPEYQEGGGSPGVYNLTVNGKYQKNGDPVSPDFDEIPCMTSFWWFEGK